MDGRRYPKAGRVRHFFLFCGALAGGMLAVVEAAPPLIALDVGHSATVPGAISARGRTEFSFNADLVGAIHAELITGNSTTLQIGANGDVLALTQRTEEARAARATFFLSVHHDSAQEHYLQPWEWNGEPRRFTDRFSGFSLFVSRRNAYLQKSLRCASAMGAALRQRGFVPTPHHAERIPGESREWADEANGVYFFDNLVVLRTASSPAVLFEAGVILNPAEELRLRSPELQRSMALAIRDGLKGCGALGRKQHQSRLPYQEHSASGSMGARRHPQ